MTETDTCFKILRVQPEALPSPAPRFQGGQRALGAGTRGAAVPLGLGVAPSRRRSRRQGRPPIGTARARTHAPSRARRAALRPCPPARPARASSPGGSWGPRTPAAAAAAPRPPAQFQGPPPAGGARPPHPQRSSAPGRPARPRPPPAASPAPAPRRAAAARGPAPAGWQPKPGRDLRRITTSRSASGCRAFSLRSRARH